MFWKETKNSLGSILDSLNDTFSTVQGDQEVFAPLLRTHPPSLRNTRREILEDQMEDVSAAWDQILLIEARVVQLKEEIKTRRVMRLAMTRSPVFTLPDEILRRIFVHVCFNREADDVEQYRSSIRLACRHWHAIASTRYVVSLCVTLPSARTINPIVPALLASNPHRVRLTVGGPVTPENFPAVASSDLGRRLHSLSWSAWDDIHEFLAKLSNGNSVDGLESLTNVSVKGSDEEHDGLRAYDSWPMVHLEKLNSLSKLVDLQLEKTWTKNFLTSETLTSLTIVSCPEIRSHNVVATLRNTPNLKFLRVASIQDINYPQGILDRQYNVFKQSSLETIIINHVSGIMAWAPLYCGYYPNLRSLTLLRLYNTAIEDSFPREELPRHLRDGEPLERSFHRTLLGSEKLETLVLNLRPELLQELCGSLSMKPNPLDSDFPRVFPAPQLAHLKILTPDPKNPDAEEAVRLAGNAILDILRLRQSSLRTFTSDHTEKFETVDISPGLGVQWSYEDLNGLVG